MRTLCYAINTTNIPYLFMNLCRFFFLYGNKNIKGAENVRFRTPCENRPSINRCQQNHTARVSKAYTISLLSNGKIPKSRLAEFIKKLHNALYVWKMKLFASPIKFKNALLNHCFRLWWIFYLQILNTCQKNVIAIFSYGIWGISIIV